MALTSDLASILETLGYGTWGGGTSTTASIFTNREPDATVAAVCTTIYLTGGAPDTQTYDGDTYGERAVQIRRRDGDPVALETYVEALYALWTAWKSYPAYFLTLRASGKPLTNYPPEDSNVGSLYISSFNLRVIKGS